MGKEYEAYKKLWDVKDEAENNFKNYIENLITSNGLIPTLANFLNDICENNKSEICIITNGYPEDEPTETYFFSGVGLYVDRQWEGYKNDEKDPIYGRNTVWSIFISGLSITEFKKLKELLPEDKFDFWG